MQKCNKLLLSIMNLFIVNQANDEFFQGEKFLVLKKKYRQTSLDLTSPVFSFSASPSSPVRTPDLATPVSPLREPPPYRPPPPAPLSPVSNPTSPAPRNQNESSGDTTGIFYKNFERGSKETLDSKPFSEEPDLPTSPPVPPRRKSQDKLKLENKENLNFEKSKASFEPTIKVSLFLYFLEKSICCHFCLDQQIILNRVNCLT